MGAVVSTFVGMLIFVATRHQSAPGGFAFVGTPIHSRTGFSFAITNPSSRAVRYWVFRPEMKCGDLWIMNFTDSGSLWNPANPGPLYVPVRRTSTPPTLAPHQTAELSIDKPLHISAPPGATAWRLRVEWSYSSPAKWDQFKSRTAQLLLNRKLDFPSRCSTNYSTERPWECRSLVRCR